MTDKKAIEILNKIYISEVAEDGRIFMSAKNAADFIDALALAINALEWKYKMENCGCCELSERG